MVGREEREESGGSERYSSGSPSKSFNPNGETGFLCGERERKGGIYEGRERGKDTGDMRQGESVKRERKEAVWVITSFPLFHSLSPSLFLSLCTACMHLPFMQQAILR